MTTTKDKPLPNLPEISWSVVLPDLSPSPSQASSEVYPDPNHRNIIDAISLSPGITGPRPLSSKIPISTRNLSMLSNTKTPNLLPSSAEMTKTDALKRRFVSTPNPLNDISKNGSGGSGTLYNNNSKYSHLGIGNKLFDGIRLGLKNYKSNRSSSFQNPDINSNLNSIIPPPLPILSKNSKDRVRNREKSRSRSQSPTRLTPTSSNNDTTFFDANSINPLPQYAINLMNYQELKLILEENNKLKH